MTAYSQPVQRCGFCGRIEVVRPDGRGFPPDIAKRRLVKACGAAGCPCFPEYRAGFGISGPITGQEADA